MRGDGEAHGNLEGGGGDDGEFRIGNEGALHLQLEIVDDGCICLFLHKGVQGGYGSGLDDDLRFWQHFFHEVAEGRVHRGNHEM